MARLALFFLSTSQHLREINHCVRHEQRGKPFRRLIKDIEKLMLPFYYLVGKKQTLTQGVTPLIINY